MRPKSHLPNCWAAWPAVSRRAARAAAATILLGNLARGAHDGLGGPAWRATDLTDSEGVDPANDLTSLQLDGQGDWHVQRPTDGGTDAGKGAISLLSNEDRDNLYYRKKDGGGGQARVGDEAEEDVEEDEASGGQPKHVAPRPLHARVSSQHGRDFRRQAARSISSQALLEPQDAHQVLAELAEESFLWSGGSKDDPKEENKSPDRDNREKEDNGAGATADADGSADASDRPSGKCLAVARQQQQNGTNRLSFRIDHLSGHILSITETFELRQSADCSGELVNASVVVSPIIDVSDVLEKSYVSIHISQGFVGQTMYVCKAQSGAPLKAKPLCLAEVTWEKARFRPSQILLWMPEVPILRGLKEYTFEVDRMEDYFLTLLEWIILVGGVVLVLSAAHALHFVLTTEPCEGPPALDGLSPLSIATKVRMYTLLMVTFLIGIQSLVALSTKIIAPHVEGWVVEAVLISGLFVGVVGVVWLTRISCIVQINEAALMHGKCVMPLPSKLVLPLFDLIVISVFVVFLGLAGVSFILVADNTGAAEFAGCLSAFLGVVRVFNTVHEQRRSRKEGFCQVSLGKISTAVECIKGRQEDDPDGLDLLEHISDNGKVELTMDQVCVACRKGEDPFFQAQQIKKTEELPGGQDFTYQDLRWHAKFIQAKTGSKASILTVPLACALLLLMLLQFTRTAYQCKIVAPRLTRLQSSAGILVPEFSPDTKEYMLLHDRSVSSFSFLTEAAPEVSKRKVFNWTRNFSEMDATEPMMMVNLKGMESVFPFIMRVNMLGGHRDRRGIYSRHEHYRVTFAAVSHLFVSMTFKSGDWSRCIYWGAKKDKVVGLPSFREIGTSATVDIEVSTVAYAVTMPLSLEQWTNHTAEGYFGLGTVFEALEEKATEALCEQACWQYSDCIMSRASTTGCFHAMYARKQGSGCFDAHNNLAIANAEGSPLQQLDELNSAMGFLCTPGKLDWQSCTYNSTISHTGHLKFPGVTLTQGENMFNFVIGMTWAGASRRVRVQDHSIKLWRGSPLPESIFLAVPKGISYLSVSSGDIHTLQFNRFDVGQFVASKQMIQILVILLVEDDDFEVVFPEGVKPWNGDKDDFDLGLCATGDSSFRRLWVCSDSDGNESTSSTQEGITTTGIIEVDPFHLATMESLLEVRPKESSDLSSSADAAIARVGFSTVGGISPVQWALEDQCVLYSRGTYEEISDSISHEVLVAGLNSCYENGVEVNFVRLDALEDDDLVFNETISYAHFLTLAIRKERSASNRLQYLHAAWQKDEGLVKEILQSSKTSPGLELNPSLRDKDGLGCFIKQEPWRAVLIAYDDLLTDKRIEDAVDVICSLGDTSSMDAPVIPPNSFATMVSTGIVEDYLVRLLDCVKLQTPDLDEYSEQSLGPVRKSALQWFAEGSSPLVAATKANYSKFVRRVLEIYPETVGCKVELLRDGRWQLRTAGKTDHLASKLGVLEFAMVYDCPECAAASADAIHQVFTECHARVGSASEKRKRSWMDARLLGQEDCDNFMAKMGRIGLGSVGGQWNFTGLYEGLKYVVEKGVVVTVLDLRANALTNTEMDVLKNAVGSLTKLKVLRLSDNKLDYCGKADKKDGDQASSLAFLRQLERLETLELRGAKLCQGGHDMLLKALPTLPNLRRLDLSSTRMGDVDLETIRQIGNVLPAIQELNISSNSLGPTLLSGLFSSGTFQSSLTLLSIMENSLSFQEAGFLGKFIGELPQLVSLEMGHNCLGNAGMASLGAAFSTLPQLKSVDMQDICLTGEGLTTLAEAAGSISLEKLVLRDNSLGKSAVKDVASHFAAKLPEDLNEQKDVCSQPGLKFLDIRNTSFDAGIKALVRELNQSGRLHLLTHLTIDRAEDWPLGASSDLGKMLGAAPCLESFSLAELRSSVKDAKPFPVDILKELILARPLRAVDMSGFSKASLPPLTTPRPSSWRTLSLKNSICPPTGSPCFEWIRNMGSLEVIDISGSILTTTAWRNLFETFVKLQNLKEIYLAGTHFNLEDSKASTCMVHVYPLVGSHGEPQNQHNIDVSQSTKKVERAEVAPAFNLSAGCPTGRTAAMTARHPANMATPIV